MFLALTLALCLLTQFAAAQSWTLATPDASNSKAALIPFPVDVSWLSNDVTINSVRLNISEDFSNKQRAAFKKQITTLLKGAGMHGKASNSQQHYTITLVKGAVAGAHIPEEAYELTTHAEGVTLTANTSHGIFNGLQTFRQLLSNKGSHLTVAGCEIRDWPAFRTRGVMLDVGRNYMSPQFIKDQIDKLSRYKINVLHFHCTEDPAWRLQIKKHPKLTQAKYHWKTRQPGKHYTHEEIKDLVAFCAARHIEVIPEIDMPGHSEAFRHAMGVDMQTKEGIAILKDVIDEVVELFPSNKIHIGSDEVRISMKEFMPTMVEYVRTKGKEVIVWSPGLLPDNKVIKMHWGDHTGHQVDKSIRHISTIGFYMDWIDSQSGVYQYFFQQPCDAPQGNDKAMGAITCVWTDGALSGEDRVLKQYPFYPCMVTFAERIWRGANESRPEFFAKLPQPKTAAYVAFSEFENRLAVHRDLYFKGLPFTYVKQAHIPWRLIGPFDHKGKNDTSFGPEEIIQDSYKDGDKTLTWEDKSAWGGAIHLRHTYSVFDLHQKRANPDYWPATMNHKVGKSGGTCYALTYIHSSSDQDTHLMFGIGGMWGHSGGYRVANAPDQGQWDSSGGDIWLNDKRVNPPKWPFKSLPWTGWGKGRIEEAPLTEEGYFFRPPVKVSLNKGWNKVLIRVPFGWWNGDRGQRKWFFNCIPVQWDGTHYREHLGLQFKVSTADFKSSSKL